MKTFTTLLALLATTANAHFLLNYPTTIGFSDDDEGTAPCGGFTPDFTAGNVTDFYVGGDAIALRSTHPAAVWLFRATLDQTAAGNWTALLPTVSQDQLGYFCEQNVTVPSTWAGQKGIIGVVQDAVDGFLYQCAAVNFVAGPSTTVPSTCTNTTGLTAVFSAAPALSSLVSTTSTSNSTASTAASTTSATAAATSSSAANAMAVGVWAGLAGSAALVAFVL